MVGVNVRVLGLICQREIPLNPPFSKGERKEWYRPGRSVIARSRSDVAISVVGVRLPRFARNDKKIKARTDRERMVPPHSDSLPPGERENIGNGHLSKGEIYFSLSQKGDGEGFSKVLS
jgi:hypothetical protein